MTYVSFRTNVRNLPYSQGSHLLWRFFDFACGFAQNDILLKPVSLQQSDKPKFIKYTQKHRKILNFAVFCITVNLFDLFPISVEKNYGICAVTCMSVRYAYCGVGRSCLYSNVRLITIATIDVYDKSCGCICFLYKA